MSADSPETAPRIVYLVGRTERGLRTVLGEVLQEVSLSIPEYTAMSVLDRRPGLSNAQLARRSLIAPQSMINVIARLERRGIVEREIDPSHGRILRTHLTKAGRKTLRETDAKVGRLEDDLLADVPEQARKIVREALQSMVTRMRDDRRVSG